jgi:hypothetical protein
MLDTCISNAFVVSSVSRIFTKIYHDISRPGFQLGCMYVHTRSMDRKNTVAGLGWGYYRASVVANCRRVRYRVDVAMCEGI